MTETNIFMKDPKKSGACLQISPTILNFPLPHNKPILRNLKLQNITNETVYFKIKATAPKRYSVRPTTDLILPGETKEVQVILNYMKDPVSDPRATDSFQVLSFIADKQNSEELKDLKNIWQNIPPSNLFKYKFHSSFLPPQIENQPKDTTTPVHSNFDSDQLQSSDIKIQEESSIPERLKQSATEESSDHLHEEITALQNQLKQLISEREHLKQQLENRSKLSTLSQREAQNELNKFLFLSIIFFILGVVIGIFVIS